MTYLMAAILAILTVETWLLWRALSGLGALHRVDERLGRLSQTMLLLTDATETCFHTLAGRLEPQPEAARPTAARKAGRTRRVVGAARHGRSAIEIAAAEDVAEGEVRLRLHLAGHEEKPDVKKEGRRGAVRS